MDSTRKASGAPARKIMVVIDPIRKSAGALQYALSHAVLEHDTLVLLQLENPNAWKNPFGALFRKQSLPAGNNGGGYSFAASSFSSSSSSPAAAECGDQMDFIEAMKHACTAAIPKLRVVVEKAEMADGRDKAALILSQSAGHKIDLLIIGQRRSLSNAILGSRRRGGSLRGFDTADFLIENSKCTCVAVQKKGQNGGYILNSKTQKLLAFSLRISSKDSVSVTLKLHL